jgi:MYXO-CTERM domain-containing protein
MTLDYAGACVIVVTVGGTSQVPEPSSYGLVGAALAGMFAAPALRRRKDRTAA